MLVWMVGLSFLPASSMALANPKSDILAIPLLSRIFSGLRSRWKIFLSYKNSQPWTMSRKMGKAYFSEMRPRDLMIAPRSLNKSCITLRSSTQKRSIYSWRSPKNRKTSRCFYGPIISRCWLRFWCYSRCSSFWRLCRPPLESTWVTTYSIEHILFADHLACQFCVRFLHYRQVGLCETAFAQQLLHHVVFAVDHLQSLVAHLPFIRWLLHILINYLLLHYWRTSSTQNICFG